MRILPTRKAASKYNRDRLRDLKVHILRIDAKHSGCNNIHQVSITETGNLYAFLTEAISAKVMLTESV